MAFLLAVISAVAAQSAPVIGDGWGLDHVLIGLGSPQAVVDVFHNKLGFTAFRGVEFPVEGLTNAIISLPPTYIELLWPYQAAEPGSLALAQVVRDRAMRGGGIAAYNLNVSPAEQVAASFRRLGLRASLPKSPTIRMPDGEEFPGPWQFVDVDVKDQAAALAGVPGGAGVGFLEYQHNSDLRKPERFLRARDRAMREAPDPRRSAGEIHANTARKLLSVWVVVPSVARAVRQAERFGFVPTRRWEIKLLGERGREVQCGEGTLVFLQPNQLRGPFAQVIRTHGFGPFGIAVEVADIDAAKRVVEEGVGEAFSVQIHGGRKSFVVPAQLTEGTFIEFVQSEPAPRP